MVIGLEEEITGTTITVVEEVDEAAEEAEVEEEVADEVVIITTTITMIISILTRTALKATGGNFFPKS